MIRRLVAAGTILLVLAVAILLAASAALDIHWDPQHAVALAIAAVFLPQSLLVAHLLSRKGRRK